MTAATTAKIATQITVTNQKTKSMRPASRPAGVGSHAGTSARVAAAPPATRAKSTSWTTDPRRTEHEPNARRGGLAESKCGVRYTRHERTRSGPISVVSLTPSHAGHRGDEGGSMGLGVGIFLTAIGAILAFAVSASVSGVNIQT